MNLSDLKKQFDALKKRENTRTQTTSREKDPRVLSWVQGHTYKMRLIFWYPEGGERKDPFINQFRHGYWDKETRERGDVICPTSEYISDRRGFDECKTCGATNLFYKDYDPIAKKWKSVVSKDLYTKFKRRFYGFALVYVVSDPANEANNGHVRIMPYGDTIHQYLKKKIFGIEKIKGKWLPVKDEDSIIGFSAFDFEKGSNFHVDVTPNESDPKWNDYAPEFARKETDLGISIEDLETELKALNFDRDFFKRSSPAELDKFYSQFVVRDAIEEETEGEEATPPDEDETATEPKSRVINNAGAKVASAPLSETEKAKTDEVPMTFKEDKKPKKVKEETAPVAAPQSAAADAPASDIDFSDIDALLDKAEKSYGKK